MLGHQATVKVVAFNAYMVILISNREGLGSKRRRMNFAFHMLRRRNRLPIIPTALQR